MKASWVNKRIWEMQNYNLKSGNRMILIHFKGNHSVCQSNPNLLHTPTTNAEVEQFYEYYKAPRTNS